MKLVKSIQDQFIILIFFLIISLTLPVMFSGIYFMNQIIYQNSEKILKIKLDELVQKLENRYKILKRFGLEDSTYHLNEIKQITLKEFEKFRFLKTGRVFVLNKNGEPILFPKNKFYASKLLEKLNKSKKHFIECSINKCFIYYTYYPKWNSYIGISISKKELFAAKYKFIKFVMFSLLFGLLLAFFIIYFMRSKIIQPAIEISSYAKRIKDGDLNASIKGKFLFEFEELKNAIIVMVTFLKQVIEKIENQVKLIKKREDEINEEKEKLSTTINNIAEGILTIDKNKKIILANASAEKVLGCTYDSIIGKNINKILKFEKNFNLNEELNKIFNNKNTLFYDRISLYSQNDKIIPVSLTISAIKDIHNEINGCVVIFKDISEQLKMEEEILKVEKLKTIQVLAGGIAHDFNNILTGILGNIELLKEYYKKNIDKEKMLQKINQLEQATTRAQELSYQLLTFSKGGEPVKKSSSLKELITFSADFILRGSKIKVIYKFPETLWNVNVDPGQINQVLQNIILNAAESFEDEGTIIIECNNLESYKLLEDKKHKDWVEIKIIDNGKGMPKEILNKIFDPFFTTKTTGSGLGLSICYSIIKKHDSFIEIDSNEGKGTTVRIILPAIKEEKNEKNIFSKHTDSNNKKENKKLNILIIDDEKDVREVLKEVLTYLGHNVVTVENGIKGIEIFKKQKFDLVITDLTIPGCMGGEKIAKELLKINPNIKIVVFSGYSENPIMANYKQYGFSGVLKKPMKIDEIKKLLFNLFK